MSDVYVSTTAAMGTVVTIQVVGHDADVAQRANRASTVERAMEWFVRIEETCTRFDPASELRRLTDRVGEAVRVSPILFETVRFALALADDSGGAFDPTIGHRMQELGFDREHRGGTVSRASLGSNDAVSYRDVCVDAAGMTVTIRRPLVLDLGGVAKGFAIDMAARELAPLGNFAIDAGGDLYLGGRNQDGEPWSVGIRHPRDERQLVDTLCITNVAVCTSGDYERTTDAGHHIIDPREGGAVSATGVASVTVIAPMAMVADGLATAAFVLGPVHGLALLDRHGVEGLIVTPALEVFRTRDP